LVNPADARSPSLPALAGYGVAGVFEDTEDKRMLAMETAMVETISSAEMNRSWPTARPSCWHCRSAAFKESNSRFVQLLALATAIPGVIWEHREVRDRHHASAEAAYNRRPPGSRT
jgi:hypothetical protein